jgi:hypothetical protein
MGSPSVTAFTPGSRPPVGISFGNIVAYGLVRRKCVDQGTAPLSGLAPMIVVLKKLIGATEQCVATRAAAAFPHSA